MASVKKKNNKSHEETTSRQVETNLTTMKVYSERTNNARTTSQGPQDSVQNAPQQDKHKPIKQEPSK
ncbi:hypothetical protein H5410_030362 [Solanum commersonii]|uniref:Uncharacterized protein n=1 Tax=Solanum commersonii TaxID=4109 RepID=A0A9J5YH79_SOLCO|nr:hypothetical protein H5410_030362 [Solanum commersonii]